MAHAESGDWRLLKPRQPAKAHGAGVNFLDKIIEVAFDAAAVVITQFPAQKRVRVFRGEAGGAVKVTPQNKFLALFFQKPSLKT